MFTRLPDPDVFAYVSDLPLPIFSGAIAPRFAPGTELRRAGELLEALLANGQPFQWWSGALTRSVQVEELLAARGLVTEGLTPGMHADLAAVDLPDQDGPVSVEVCSTDEEWLEANRVFTEAFEIPAEFAEVFVAVWRAVPGSLQLVARVGGVPVGAAAGVALDGVMGVYNVGTLEAARRQGVGRATTAALMRMGREAGCHSAILHASELGYPVYEGLGFEHVTDISQYVWLPTAT
ncbi:GNAT family N-acetyltransferase [Nostocoides sp. HKS02]|uniref:GNAT family N-acetyltransferase n=1 Tax=Nostocoides sp. HKS02 TaxID=1813880 RepID=UPI0012B50432|nr:GNAT family N-acetyltransferase [Tetrasphaera sp. HKS02]QGN58758.1 GNAT family N-acetyltransferase [Tetrasphaera sp. HKS02]